VPGLPTDITEIITALGTLGGDLESVLESRPDQLHNVSDDVWERLVRARADGEHAQSFLTAHTNGSALLAAEDGLRGRVPRLIEWRGPYRLPGDDVVPADLRLDHVFLVSCKYLSQVLMNASPARLFDRLLVGDERGSPNWFETTAPDEYANFYRTARAVTAMEQLPLQAGQMARSEQRELRQALGHRTLPVELRPAWSALSGAVSRNSARRWEANLATPRQRLRLLWKLLRITNATYYVLGTDRAAHLRLRVVSAWDWNQAFDLRSFEVRPRDAGQPEVGWTALVEARESGSIHVIDGHVEIRWSHGRFVGVPEAKVYLDTPHHAVPGYEPLR
jgi:hypothetical protein